MNPRPFADLVIALPAKITLQKFVFENFEWAKIVLFEMILVTYFNNKAPIAFLSEQKKKKGTSMPCTYLNE